jgi:hypothetical protein
MRSSSNSRGWGCEMASTLNRLRRQAVAANLSTASALRKAGFADYARQSVGYARYDRQCATRGGWKLP